MLEIIALIFLSRNIGEIAYEKGYSSGLYRFLTVAFWIVFEFIGAFVGAFILGEGYGIYFFALISAGLGYLIIYLIVSTLKDKEKIEFAKYLVNSPSLPVYEKAIESSKVMHEFKTGDIIQLVTTSDFGRFYRVQISPEEKGYILKNSNITKQ
jgi:hypothetical protein